MIGIIFRKLGERGFEDFILPVIFQDCDLDPAVKGLHKVRFDPRHSALVNFWEKMMRPFQINDLSDEFKKMDFERYYFLLLLSTDSVATPTLCTSYTFENSAPLVPAKIRQ